MKTKDFLRLLYWSLVKTAPRKKYADILFKLKRYQKDIASCTPGIDSGVMFFTHLFNLKLYLEIEKVRITGLRKDILLFGGGSYEELLRAAAIDAILFRTEERCTNVKNTDLYYFSVSVKDSKGVTNTTLRIGNRYGIKAKSVFDWNKERENTHTGVRGTDFFNSHNNFQVMDYYFADFMKDEMRALISSLERLTSLLSAE